jgi:hypothetical protein
MRASARREVALAARLTWKDQRGTVRFASVTLRDVSDFGAYVECQSPVTIPLFRLAQLQIEREGRGAAELPEPLRRGSVLSAVYRVSPRTQAGRLQGLALRLMVEPRRAAETERIRATA